MKEEYIAGYGMIDITPDKNLIVNSWNEFIISYISGKKIEKGGSLRITIPHFFTDPHINNDQIIGYTALSSNNKIKASLRINSSYGCGYENDGHTGRYGKSIFVNLSRVLHLRTF